jgi:hypothetical protein
MAERIQGPDSDVFYARYRAAVGDCKAGRLSTSWDLAEEYDLYDVDGSRRTGGAIWPSTSSRARDPGGRTTVGP